LEIPANITNIYGYYPIIDDSLLHVATFEIQDVKRVYKGYLAGFSIMERYSLYFFIYCDVLFYTWRNWWNHKRKLSA
jgi:hypothetical protein